MLMRIIRFLGLSGSSKAKNRIEKNIERRIVANLSEGNIHLQGGRYLTGSEIDAIRKKAFS